MHAHGAIVHGIAVDRVGSERPELIRQPDKVRFRMDVGVCSG